MPRRLIPCLSFLLAVACGASSGPSPATGGPRGAARGDKAASQAGPKALAATQIAEITGITYGPYVGTREDGAIVIWATPGQEQKQGSFVAVPLSKDGTPLGAARKVSDAPPELGLVTVRPHAAGYLVLYTRGAPGGQSVEALCVSAQGERVGPPPVLGVVSGRVLWTEALLTKRGSLAFFASRAEASSGAEIQVVSLDASCKASERTELSKDARAWQAAPLGAGAVLAVARGQTGGAAVDAIVVDSTGARLGTTAVSTEPTADRDLDAVALGKDALLAWTDRRFLEPRILSAVLDARGKLKAPPAPLTDPEGEQALVRLLPAGERAYAVWENFSDVPVGEGRRFQLSALGPSGHSIGPRAVLEHAVEDGSLPELRASARGLSILTLAPVCQKTEACEGKPAGPTFVDLDTMMEPRIVEPVRLESISGEVADVSFGLGCTASGCFSLSALAQTPTPVFATKLSARSEAWRAPLSVPDAGQKPRMAEHEAVSKGPPLAAIAALRSGDRDILALVSAFDDNTPWQRLTKPGPDGRRDPTRATLALERILPVSGPSEPLRVSPVSLRAQARAGVALAEGANGEVLVVWGGVDAGEPQVFLTLVGKGGEKLSQRMFTKKKGDLGDVAAAWVGDGWVVSWIDERSGSAQVFTAKVDPRLNEVSKEKSITGAAGSVADLAMSAGGEALRLVWSEVRSDNLPGHADVYSVELERKDGSPRGEPLRISSSPGHSFSPQVARFGKSDVVAWLERDEPGVQEGGIGLCRLTPSKSGEVMVEAGGRQPRALALDCAERECHVVVTLDLSASTQIGALSFPGSGTPTIASLGRLRSSVGADVTPVLHGSTLYYIDAAEPGGDQALVHRAKIAW